MLATLRSESFTAWRAHCIEYLYEDFVGEAHGGVELKDSLCLPEDFCANSVLEAGAIEGRKHAARFRNRW